MDEFHCKRVYEKHRDSKVDKKREILEAGSKQTSIEDFLGELKTEDSKRKIFFPRTAVNALSCAIF